MEWVAKITTVALEMFLPAVAGAYIDRRMGTGYWAIVGVVVGFVVGMWHLLQMTRRPATQAAANKAANKAAADDTHGGKSEKQHGGSAGE
jgi:uncharacterized protein YqgC (DUF456 family)